MRRFDYPVVVSATPCRRRALDKQPVHTPAVYDAMLFEEDAEGNVAFGDITRILLHAEKFRRRFGDAIYNDLLRELHPTRSTVQDGMTDEARFDSIISRHCQSISERQTILRDLTRRMDSMSEDFRSQFESYMESLNTPASTPQPTPSNE